MLKITSNWIHKPMDDNLLMKIWGGKCSGFSCGEYCIEQTPDSCGKYCEGRVT